MKQTTTNHPTRNRSQRRTLRALAPIAALALLSSAACTSVNTYRDRIEPTLGSDARFVGTTDLTSADFVIVAAGPREVLLYSGDQLIASAPANFGDTVTVRPLNDPDLPRTALILINDAERARAQAPSSTNLIYLVGGK